MRALVGAFNKEKVLLGAFSRHCESLVDISNEHLRDGEQRSDAGHGPGPCEHVHGELLPAAPVEHQPAHVVPGHSGEDTCWDTCGATCHLSTQEAGGLMLWSL